MVQQAGPGSVAEPGAQGELGGAGPDELAAMRATPSGMAMLRLGEIRLPEIFCRADALPQTDESIVTGLPAITGEDGRDGTDGSPGAPENPAPPGAPGGDGVPGTPGMIFFEGDQICMVLADGTIKCTTLYEPAEPTPVSIAVFFDGGGAKLLNNTQVYQSIPFDADAQELKVFTDGTTGNVIVEVYRQPFGAWSPTLDTAERIASTVTSSITRKGTEPGTVGAGSVDGVVALNAGDTLIFNAPLGSIGDVTKVHASLVVVKR
ncbi:hypothetical protein LCGC14_0391340 [marine sediment metagenome]|uniref:Uncharacterized protein n=1 Tax=marine sediment metagenome TaxID=412755 RepID=A0A0F9W8G5_9ZZZZ